MAFLREDQANQEFQLCGKLTTIGRAPSCDIIVNSPMISAEHVLIVNTRGTYAVEDLDSRNGTFVNGENLSGRRTLVSGDRIELLGIRFTFCDHQPAQLPEVPPSRPVGVLQSAVPRGSTIRLAELMAAGAADVMSDLEVCGDLRLAVKPEAKLRAVLQISDCLLHSLELNDVLDQILENLFSIFPQADCGFILLRDEKTGELTARSVRHRYKSSDDPPAVSHGIVRQALMSGHAILSADAGADARFESRQSVRRLEIRSIMCVPIFREGDVCAGIVQLDSRDKSNLFQQDDLDLLVCVSHFAGQAVEVARTHAARRVMEAAIQIQKSFLPASRPACAGLNFYDHYSPAESIGGDYYDYILLPDGRIAVTIGDVSGKDLTAALLMARLSAAARVCLASSVDLARAVSQLNTLLTRAGGEDRFITFVVAVVDLDRSGLTIVNAGHLPPLLRRAHGHAVEEVAPNCSGLPLGVMNQEYEAVHVAFHQGDSLLLFTDGVSEARNSAGELYGNDRIFAVVQSAPASACGLGMALLEDVQRHTGERPAADDLTILCVARNEE